MPRPEPAEPQRVVVGITGASGAVYALRLVEVLLARGLEVHLVASAAGRQVIQAELPERAGSAEQIFTDLPRQRLRTYHEKDFFAPFCSGSFRFDAMVVIPASMGTVGAIASGYVANALHRGADVALKERRRLIVVPRETPLSPIHLRNLLALAEAGALILPPMPAFYNHPRGLADHVDFVVCRILDHLDIDNELSPRWGEERRDG
jgi:4-hydroxy-3-polyprenylbenzoate decarboxylase